MTAKTNDGEYEMTSLRAFFTTGIFPRNHPTSKILSEFIISAIAQGYRPQISNKYTMKLNGVDLWRENWPYAYGSIEKTSSLNEDQTLYEIRNYLPSRKAARLLRDAELEYLPSPEDEIKDYLIQQTNGKCHE